MKPQQTKPVPTIEHAIGIELYTTKTPGLGGRIRDSSNDFVVQEILTNGRIAGFDANSSTPGPSRSQGTRLHILVKENLDTLEALRLVAINLRIKRTSIKFLGLKDKKAKSAQFILLPPGTTSTLKLSTSNGSIRLIPIEDEQASTSHELWGNQFKIRISNVKTDAADAEERIDKVLLELRNAGGIPNFYGHQRFGTRRQVTHEVGRRIVAGTLPQATETFLWFGREYGALPDAASFERRVLNYLRVNGNDYSGAFRQLPVTLRQLFVHAFQAYVFNRFLSARIAEGLPLDHTREGDWTLKTDPGGYSHGEALVATPDNLTLLNKEIETGMRRVSLPVPGYATQLSSGPQGALERRILSEENVSLKDFYTGVLPEASSPGKLRCATIPTPLLKLNVFQEDAICAATLEFRLPKESYATILLREIMKPEEPISAGF